MTTFLTSAPLDLLTDHARLPGAELLLDASRLSAVLGREVRLDRVRIKPTAAVHVSYRAAAADTAGRSAADGLAAGGATTSGATASGTTAEGAFADGATVAAPGRALADVGWVQLLASRDKRDNILRRAARGEQITVRTPALRTAEPVPAAAAGEGPYLLSGGVDSDPRLGRNVRRVLHRLRGGTAPRVLSYNPSRHLVLFLPDRGEVLRVAARPLDDQRRISAHWQALGLPTVVQQQWRSCPEILVGEHWGQGDLAALGSHPRSVPAATRLGEVIARLHSADATGRDLQPARIGAPIPETTEAVADLLPHCLAPIEQLSTRLQDLLREEEPQVLIHGDLSPDQVLFSAAETAGTAGAADGGLEIRVVDLDRSGLGPRTADLGSWLASCLLSGMEEQASAFLGGYARHLALPSLEVLAAWTSRALLSAALDPMRRCDGDWLPAVEGRLALAEAILDDPARLPLPAETVGRPTAKPTAGPTEHSIAEPTAGSTTGPTVDPTAAPAADPTADQSPLVPTWIEHEGGHLLVRRAWADDGRGLPLELSAPATTDATADDTAEAAGSSLRAGRLDPATGQVTVFPAGTDPRLPALARVLTEQPGSVLVSHRAGKRAVVRTTGGSGEVNYVKIVRPGRTEKLLAAVGRAGAFDGPFRLAEVLDSDEETVTFAELPGQLLHDGLPTADGTWRRAWRDTLEAWAAAVEISRRGTGAGTRTGTAPAEVHGPDAEAELLGTWCARADAVDPSGAAVRGRAVSAARRDLSRLGAVERPALIHRDLHDKQILWREGERPALLDVDTATAGDPALDIANLRAHATWRELQGIWSEEQAAVVREEIHRAAARIGIPPETLAAYESGTIARLVCVYAFRPRWRQAARDLAATLTPAPLTPAPLTPAPLTPAPAGSPTPLGGAATHAERSLSR